MRNFLRKRILVTGGAGLNGNGPIALNLGTGLGHSVREIIRAVERVEGVRVPTREGPRRPGTHQR